MYCRDLTKKYSTVRVISGPLYLPSQPEGQGGKRYVKYQVIKVLSYEMHAHAGLLESMVVVHCTLAPFLDFPPRVLF